MSALLTTAAVCLGASGLGCLIGGIRVITRQGANIGDAREVVFLMTGAIALLLAALAVVPK